MVDILEELAHRLKSARSGENEELRNWISAGGLESLTSALVSEMKTPKSLSFDIRRFDRPDQVRSVNIMPNETMLDLITAAAKAFGLNPRQTNLLAVKLDDSNIPTEEIHYESKETVGEMMKQAEITQTASLYLVIVPDAAYSSAKSTDWYVGDGFITMPVYYSTKSGRHIYYVQITTKTTLKSLNRALSSLYSKHAKLTFYEIPGSREVNKVVIIPTTSTKNLWKLWSSTNWYIIDLEQIKGEI